MSWKCDGDWITIEIDRDTYDVLQLALGIAAGHVSRESVPLATNLMALANQVNEGNPNWIRYEGIEALGPAEAHRLRHVFLHRQHRELLAELLKHVPTATRIWELNKWSYEQTIKAGEEPTASGADLRKVN